MILREWIVAKAVSICLAMVFMVGTEKKEGFFL